MPLTVAKDAAVTLSRKARRNMKVTLAYDGPVPAPVARGQVVGKLVVTAPDAAAVEFPVVAARDVPKLTGVSRALTSVRELLLGHRGQAIASVATPRRD